MQQGEVQQAPDFKHIFESAPDLYLLLTPEFIIIGASDAYLASTLTKREEVMGRHLFDVFPDNPDDPLADGVQNLRASLNTVLSEKIPNRMAIQKYDVPRPDGSFEEKYWSPLNTPVLDENKKVTCIIHKVEDVTEDEHRRRLIRKQEAKTRQLEQLSKTQQESLLASENNFSVIFNFCPVAILKISVEDGRIIRVNKEFENLFLLTREAVVGKTIPDLKLIDEQSLNVVLEKINNKTNEIAEIEMEVMANGVPKNMLAFAETISVAGKKCYLLAIMDITHRKSIENELKRTNEFLDTVLENIPNIVAVKLASDLSYLRINKAGSELMGFETSELYGKNDEDILGKEKALIKIKQDQTIIASGQLADVEELLATKSGDRWLRTKKIPVSRENSPGYLISISEDFTDEKQQRDAIIDLNKELEAFSFSVSHDLRAPLRAIAGYAEIMDTEHSAAMAPDAKRLLAKITANAEKMAKLIDELLAFSRLGRKEIQKKEIDLHELVEKIISDQTSYYKARPEIKIGPLGKVNGDRTMLTMVIDNLVSNAIKYSSKKDFPLIEINATIRAKDIVFSIRDNGAGFDMKYAHKLFGVFQRLHRQDEFEGTGVGLAIAERIIKKHNGTIWADSVPNEGATFFFTIPANE